MNKIENKHQDFRMPAPVNRQYKDRLFRVVFREKKDLLALYNAVNGTDYQNEDELIITTLEDVIYLGMKNDMSFMISATMNLYEQHLPGTGSVKRGHHCTAHSQVYTGCRENTEVY